MEKEAEREIEITSAMIEVGVRVLEDHGPYQDAEVLARMVYSAMEAVRRG